MSENLPKQQPTDEVDLGQLFKLIGRVFERFFTKSEGFLFRAIWKNVRQLDSPDMTKWD